VGIKVNEISNSPQGSGKPQRETSLKIIVTNREQKELSDLQVRYFLFTKDVKGNNPILGQSGSKRMTLASGVSDNFESKGVAYEYHPQHYEKDQQGNQKKVLAFGNKYCGYVVQVRRGDAVVGEEISPELKGKVDPKTLNLKQ
jgi:hypothetical protein